MKGGRPKEFSATRVSPSRVNKLTECGVAFKMYYLDGIPPKVHGSYALFGSVVHNALEHWAPDRSRDLVSLMRGAWIAETAEKGPVVAEFLTEYAKINVAVMLAERNAKEVWESDKRNAGKTSKAPRMTAIFKKDPACLALNRLLAQWMPKLNAGSPWAFNDRDPLPQFYDDSLVLAKRYAARWSHLLPPLYTEFEFTVHWRGFDLNGHIDTVELLVNPESGEVTGLLVNDYKTYKKQPAEHKDYRQLVMYDVAVREMIRDGRLVVPGEMKDLPIYVGIDYVRYAGVEGEWPAPGGNSRSYWKIGTEDHDRLERELIAYRNTVEGGNFLPAAKGTNPDFCDYGEDCCLRSTSQAGGAASPCQVTQ